VNLRTVSFMIEILRMCIGKGKDENGTQKPIPVHGICFACQVKLFYTLNDNHG